MNSAIETYVNFEKLCIKLFKVLKTINIENINNIQKYDFLLKNNNKKAIVEVKLYRTRKQTKKEYENLLEKLNGHFSNINDVDIELKIAIFGNKIENDIKNLAKQNYEILILDANNLLYLFNRTNFKDEYTSFLNNAIIYKESYEEELPDIDFLNFIKYQDTKILDQTEDSFIKDLKSIPKGEAHFTKYEEIGIEILKHLFTNDLVRWENQKVTDEGLNRYDAVCRVKKNNNEFWNFIVDEFNSRYLIFEFKNYSNKISQTEIFTTEKYLYPKALRNVAFIISRKGADDNAIKVTKGILRETGKLIINLTDNNLYDMLEMKKNNSEPSDYLFEIIDNFLLKLEK